MLFMKTNDEDTISNAQNLLYEELFKPLGLSFDTKERLKASGEEIYFVCKDDSELFGVMLLVIDKNEVLLHQAAIKTAYQNQGIGKKLWGEVIHYLRSEGINFVQLYSRNTSIHFWESVSFRCISEDWLEADLFIQHGIRHKKMGLIVTDA